MPKVRDDFHTRSYWDKFNRETKEFEWYGNWEQLEFAVRKYAKPDDRILVVGCGNSALSAAMYDAGFQAISNTDFDESIVTEMRERNECRSGMDWQTMDMRSLTFDDASYDVVIDKGALDALMSGPESRLDADAMMASIARVLKPGGFYLCVTLAQEFVFERLTTAFSNHYSTMSLHILEAASGDSSHVPFMCSLSPRGDGRKPAVAGDPRAVSCWFGKEGSSAMELPIGRTWGAVTNAQARFKMNRTRERLKTLAPGRIERVELWAGTGEEAKGPKYSLTVLDSKGFAAQQPMAAFIVPQGREHEYLFSADDGLRQISASASCSRLLSVTLNRGHRFESLEAVQEELGACVVDFAPSGVSGKIPFMTTADSLGSRDIVHRGTLLSGDEYMVEETELDGCLLRRLVFAQNTNVIQTEVSLLPVGKSTNRGAGGGSQKSKKGGSGKNKGGKKNKRGGSLAKKQGERDELQDVTDELDALASLAINRHSVDYSFLCFDYHRAILAGMAMVSDKVRDRARPADPSPASPGDGGVPFGAVIGLGGGALPMALHHFFPEVPLVVCELDPSVAAVARDWFGFREDKTLSVAIANGLEFDLGEGQHAFIVLDVDSKDTSVGMSCPPLEFLSPGFLGRVKAALVPGGMLAVNVAARSADMHKQALDSIRTAFPDGSLFALKASDDDVNTVVFAVNGTITAKGGEQGGESSGQKGKKKGGSKGSKSAVASSVQTDLQSAVRGWLLDIPDQLTDPLDLIEILEGLRAI